jgi:2-oxoglutarate ferredoxin oxidoreductase subunit beta
MDIDNNTDNLCMSRCKSNSIFEALKNAAFELNISCNNIVIVTGKNGQYFNFYEDYKNYFNVIESESLYTALGIKLANPTLKVIAENNCNFLSPKNINEMVSIIKKNPSIINIAYECYGNANKNELESNLNLSQIAILSNASFVARVLDSDLQKMKEIFVQAINHKGYVLIEIIKRCRVYDEKEDFYLIENDKIYYVNEKYNNTSKIKALETFSDNTKLALGILYINKNLIPYEDALSVYKNNSEPLFKRNINIEFAKDFIDKINRQ